VLHRVFVEAIDDLPHGALTRSAAPTRAQTFVYAALPRAAASFRTYLFFQFEVNVRAGIALGLVGAGGLGHYFRANLDWRRHDVAATFLLTMVLLTVVIDRTARLLRLDRRRC
jgi:phosphonate transport system permease protein